MNGKRKRKRKKRYKYLDSVRREVKDLNIAYPRDEFRMSLSFKRRRMLLRKKIEAGFEKGIEAIGRNIVIPNKSVRAI